MNQYMESSSQPTQLPSETSVPTGEPVLRKDPLEIRFEECADLIALYNSGMSQGLNLRILQSYVDRIVFYTLKPNEREKILSVDERYMKHKKERLYEYETVIHTYTSKKTMKKRIQTLDVQIKFQSIIEVMEDLHKLINDKHRTQI